MLRVIIYIIDYHNLKTTHEKNNEANCIFTRSWTVLFLDVGMKHVHRCL